MSTLRENWLQFRQLWKQLLASSLQMLQYIKLLLICLQSLNIYYMRHSFPFISVSLQNHGWYQLYLVSPFFVFYSSVNILLFSLRSFKYEILCFFFLMYNISWAVCFQLALLWFTGGSCYSGLLSDHKSTFIQSAQSQCFACQMLMLWELYKKKNDADGGR